MASIVYYILSSDPFLSNYNIFLAIYYIVMQLHLEIAEF